MRSKKITLNLLDGSPYGVRVARLSNWNGRLIISSRAAIKNLKPLEEANSPAVYFLLGNENQIYVGETDSLISRILDHATNKDWWDEIIAFSSEDLGKTEVKYLESVFVNKLQNDGLISLHNSKPSKSPTIMEADRDAMDEFIETASDVLVALGYDFIDVSNQVENDAENGVEVFCSGPNAKASGIWSSEGLLIHQGSLIRVDETKSIPEKAKRIRKAFVETGKLGELDGNNSWALVRPHLFESASLAAEFVLGRSENGLTKWKTSEGKTIKELEQE